MALTISASACNCGEVALAELQRGRAIHNRYSAAL
jgi:hypothetical protein